MKFDPSAVHERLTKFWSLQATYGKERGPHHTYLNEIVSDRYALVNGLQLLHDELQLASEDVPSDIVACGVDLRLPSVVTTLAHTNCGDRIHQGNATTGYNDMVASRFATMSESGDLKLEAFHPTGGGTDDGATLAHVTVAHQLDEPLRRRVYQGHPQSFVLVNIDLNTHVGRLRKPDGTLIYGRAQESPWREPRAACGAIVGTLASFNAENNVHRRIRGDLGEQNFTYLSKQKVLTETGIDITAVVAAAIVSIQGMHNTAKALTTEMDERGCAHLTASININLVAQDDMVIYLARATVFQGEIRMQGLGTIAQEYGGKMVDQSGSKRLMLTYGGSGDGSFPILSTKYETNQSHHHH